VSVHLLFDLLAWSGGIGLGYFVRKRWLAGVPTPGLLDRPWWYASGLMGGVLGAYVLGTLNVRLAGMAGDGRSVAGALAGAIIGIELYKALAGMKGSTGIGVVASLAFGIAVGRIGCLLAGIEDYTYGIPTSLPWGMDFGDGVTRHPVQLYESLSMAAFLVWFLRRLAAGGEWLRRHGFAVFVAVYAGQRFLWEFLKPYPTVLGPFNLFHLLCLGLLAYGGVMLHQRRLIHADA
jgi:prolipoprotein diacylglyceryltransferase